MNFKKLELTGFKSFFDKFDYSFKTDNLACFLRL